AYAELRVLGVPPCDIGARLVFSFVHRQPALSFLIVKVGSHLQIVRHIPRASDKEVNGISAHAVAEWKTVLAHAVRKNAVVVPDTGGATFTTGDVSISPLETEISCIIREQLWNVDADQIGATVGDGKLVPFIL